MSDVPTEKLEIQDPSKATEEIFEFAKLLEESGERPWFEVHYPKPEGMDQETYDQRNAESFDAVEVRDDEIFTLPPYKKLREEAKS